jgi:uncharacterized membrane protein YbhN (UPF0104 family)
VAALGGYLWFVGVDTVLQRISAVSLPIVAVILLIVIAEGLADSIGVWASIRPLGNGLSPRQSVQFALAGDFFDTLSPAGPVSSEPIMARFIGVTTDTSYSDALGVRSVAKYAKSAGQLFLSTVLGVVILLRGTPGQSVIVTLGGAMIGLFVAGALIVWWWTSLSRGIVWLVTPLVTRISSLYRAEPYDRRAVVDALDRFWSRIVRFRSTPELLFLIVVGGVVEQLVTAVALWTALAGTGSPVALIPIIVVVPLPQVASVVPVPGSVGAYDVLMSGTLVVMTGAAPGAAAAAVLLVRTIMLPFGVTAGGLSVAFLRGWRP